MRRREFIALLGAGVAGWPLAARAQQAERTRRIGLLSNLAENDTEVLSWVTAFREQLERAGWTEGRNIRFDIRWGAGDLSRLSRYAEELVSLMPDVAFADSTPVIAALQKE